MRAINDTGPESELERLRKENDLLKGILSEHGIQWEGSQPLASGPNASVPPVEISQIPVPSLERFSAAEKIAIFRRLFRGRTDVYPLRWESAKGKAGYSPACGNEWRRGLCNKPKTKCSDCSERHLKPVTDQVIYNHLSGKHTVGVYPLNTDETCYFLAADFDKADWREDALAVMHSCKSMNIPAALEISRSGNGAHVWIFFSEPVPAFEARRLGAALISHTCNRTRQLSLSSYDRLFPNQDTIPKGGFGNLIALPLQKYPREQGFSVFVDENFVPFPDQWAFLESICPMSRSQLENITLLATGGNHPLDVAFVIEEDNPEPWKRLPPVTNKLLGPLPESLTVVLANQIFVRKTDLPQQLINRLIRLAAFQNPEFYKAQAMRLPVWDKPRVIGCADNFSEHIGLPRGCLNDLLVLLQENNIRIDVQDERVMGSKLTVKFLGELRKDQKTAIKVMMQKDVGVLCAPTAFGKTVTAAALIARRKRSTLILVHRTELMRQWQERLATFLDIPKGALGLIGGGKMKPTGKIDIAVLQSLSRRDDLVGVLDGYGQIIVDECHHLSAFSFEAVLKQAKARYVVGLTATPIRRDGHQPIIFMQCGPVQHTALRPEHGPVQLEVWPQVLDTQGIPEGGEIQDVFRHLAQNIARTRRIAEDILAGYLEGRKILVLTERTEHLELLHESLENQIKNCFILHGRISKKQRAFVLKELIELDDSEPRVLIATGRLIGEGFDYPPLDTMVLAMPISWKGTLQQYAGRLHREHSAKNDVRVYDYIEHHPQLGRMWDKRRRGYIAMGYKIQELLPG